MLTVTTKGNTLRRTPNGTMRPEKNRKCHRDARLSQKPLKPSSRKPIVEDEDEWYEWVDIDYNEPENELENEFFFDYCYLYHIYANMYVNTYVDTYVYISEHNDCKKRFMLREELIMSPRGRNRWPLHGMI